MAVAAGSAAQLNTTFSTSDPTRVDWLAEYPPPRSLPLDRDALRAYEHAMRWVSRSSSRTNLRSRSAL